MKRAQEKDFDFDFVMDVEDGAVGQEQIDNPLAANAATDQGLGGDVT